MTTHFTPGEFACRCASSKCDAKPMKPQFLERLEKLRIEWDKPMLLTSARRCAEWNKRVGGSPRSQHLSGNAVDVYLPKAEIDDFVVLAEKYGFGGIGVGQNFVHIDARTKRSRWSYGVA